MKKIAAMTAIIALVSMPAGRIFRTRLDANQPDDHAKRRVHWPERERNDGCECEKPA